MLNAQQIDHVGCRQDFIDPMRNGDAELLEIARHQRAGTDQRDARAEFREAKNIRARDAAEQNVADDHDVQSGDRAFLLANGVKIEQCLRRMFVRAIAGVDHTGFQAVRPEIAARRRSCGAGR